jgi:chaperone modulatory protein CbpM
MTRSLLSVAAEVGVAAEELTVWIERSWVRPASGGRDAAFDAADLARARLIADFHRDLAIDDEAMPVVLDLIDRLHATRERLRRVLLVVAQLPPAARDDALRRLVEEQEP